jgi:hypothetical protein
MAITARANTGTQNTLLMLSPFSASNLLKQTKNNHIEQIQVCKLGAEESIDKPRDGKTRGLSV